MKNVVPQDFKVGRSDRNQQHGHRSFLLWFTGLSGSGKSTLANAVEKALFERGISTYALDGDNVRLGINKDLGFTADDRSENIRRIGEIAKLFVDAGVVVTASFISPYKKDRLLVEKILGSDSFVEIYVKASVETCESRDVKGLYKKARKGEIPNFTGISAPYEVPEAPSLVVDTEQLTLEEATEYVLSHVENMI